MNFEELSKLNLQVMQGKQKVIQNVSENLKSARKKKGLTQDQVSDRLGVTRSGYNHIENGKITINLEKLIDLCLILELKINELFNENGESNERND